MSQAVQCRLLLIAPEGPRRVALAAAVGPGFDLQVAASEPDALAQLAGRPIHLIVVAAAGGAESSLLARLSEGAPDAEIVFLAATASADQLHGVVARAAARWRQRNDVNRLLRDNQRALQQLLEHERLASMGRRAAGVAHELNNPLSYAIANVDFVTEGLSVVGSSGDRVELRQAMVDVAEGLRRMRDLVRDMRDLARVEQVERGRVAIAQVVHSAVRIAGPELRGRANVQIHVGSDLFVAGDTGRLVQVFINLLVNAAQAMGARAGNITVTGRRQGDLVVIGVADDGQGMSREVLGRLFEPFFTTRGTGSGTGLGLCVCQGIIRGHGGRIEVASAPGAGTLVTIEVPAAAVAVETRPLASGLDSVSSLEGRAQASRPRVLFVDDEVPILRAYQRVFVKDFEVSMADGREARALLRSGACFDAVVCDLLMPHVSGRDLYEDVMERCPQLGERFVFATGGTSRSDVGAFLQSCGRPVLEKPFAFGVLQTTLRRICAGA